MLIGTGFQVVSVYCNFIMYMVRSMQAMNRHVRRQDRWPFTTPHHLGSEGSALELEAFDSETEDEYHDDE